MSAACRSARLPALFAATALTGAAVAASAASHYTVADFARVAKIDAHVHLAGAADRFMAQARRDNFRVLTINVDSPDYLTIDEQQRAAVSLRQRYPGRVAFAATFSVADFQAAEWGARTQQALAEAFRQGAVGVKMWKNIGMVLQDPDGSYVMPDDERLSAVLSLLEREHVVLLGHQAEPRNCWLPPGQMTVRSDREYFEQHPQYYMYRHPEMPAHDTILAARDRALQAHPALLFDGVHLASLEWDVDEVAAFLERFPSARVDVAARLVHLEYQAARQPAKVRKFLLRYQDRILYGSDTSYGPVDSTAAAAEVHAGWLEDWRFLATAERMHSSDFAEPFQGLQLPREVIDKLYRRNAEALFVGAWSPSSTPLTVTWNGRAVPSARSKGLNCDLSGGVSGCSP